MSATLDTAAREQVRPNDPPGSDADAWFSALDDRTIELGRNRCLARVQGIHTGRESLWIQLACEGHQDISVVVRVTSATRVEDVLQRLRDDGPVGRPLEIIDMDGPRSTPAATLMGRADATGLPPASRDAH